MTINFYNSGNNTPSSLFNCSGGTQSASDLVTKPIEKVQDVITNTVDTFIKTPEDEEKKKSKKTAITAGSSVLVVTGIIALLNPQFSGKLIRKLQEKAQKAGKDSKFLKSLIDFFQFTNTVNASKDIGFKWLCAEEKFKGIKDKPVGKFLNKIDAGIRPITSKAHNSITKCFDKVSRMTVFKKYDLVDKRMNSFDELLKSYKSRLSADELKRFEQSLDEVNTARGYFSKRNTAVRLKEQERAMQTLDNDFRDRLTHGYLSQFKGFKSEGKFKDKMKHNFKHIQNNMSFWAEDMLMPQRNAFEERGKEAVVKLVGDGISTKGKYHNAMDIITPYLSKEEKALLDKDLAKIQKKLNKANTCECIEYFDKKRDLILGGAPTDILTGSVALGLSGVAISTADDKQERVSKALSLGFPAIAGIGTNFAFAAMLFSGIQSLAYGSLASVGLSMLGSKADKYLNPKPVINNSINQTEVKSA